MTFPASLQSLLVRQAMALKDQWAARYPHDWLVWEPGAWKVPARDRKMASTQFSVGPNFERPPSGDCLCFELKCLGEVKVRVGRAPENDIVLNDATVSREHLVFERSASGNWSVRPLPGSKPTKLEAGAVAEGAVAPLKSGDQVTLGGVTLTYLSAAALLVRVKAEAAKLAG